MEKLKLAAGMTGEQKRYAVEAALLLGFQTETATFPVITGSSSGCVGCEDCTSGGCR